MIGPIVYLNGAFVAKDDAKVSVFDHGFIYGDGVFEGLQIVNGTIFLLREHVERLFNSARYLGFEIPLTFDDIVEAILETARRNDLTNGYLRPIVTRGAGALGIRNMNSLSTPTVVVMAQFESIEERRLAWNRGITAQIVSVRRVPPACLDSRAKTCNYLNNIMTHRSEGRRRRHGHHARHRGVRRGRLHEQPVLRKERHRDDTGAGAHTGRHHARDVAAHLRRARDPRA